MYIGAHIARKKDIVTTLEEVRRVGGNALQIFVSNPRSGRITATSMAKYFAEAPAVRQTLAAHNCKLFVHSAYTFNISRPFSPRAYWIKTILRELEIAEALNADGVVLHTGKWVAATTPEQGLANMRMSMEYILHQLQKRNSSVKLILETSSAQGTELLPAIHDFLDFYMSFKTKSKNIGICLDTAHVHAAGSVPSSVLKTLIKRAGEVALVQMNNNPTAFGGHVDRHTPLLDASRGKIVVSELKKVVKLCHKDTIPIILETPENAYIHEIPWLANLVSGK